MASVTKVDLTVTPAPIAVSNTNGAIAIQFPDSVVAAASGRSITSTDNMLASATAAAAAVRERSAEGFTAYRVRVTGMSEADKAIYLLRSPAEEAELLQKLTTRVYEQHQTLKIEGEIDDWFNARLVEGLGKACKIEKNDFNFPDFDEEDDVREEKEGKGVTPFTVLSTVDLSPKVSSREVLDNGTKVIYENGVVEIIEDRGKGIMKNGERHFPNGIIEKGQFFYNVSDGGTLTTFESGIRVQNAKCVYRNPRLLFQNSQADVTFGYVSINGEMKLTALQRTAPQEYVLYSGHITDALLQAAQDPEAEDLISQVLTQRDLAFDPKEFFARVKLETLNPDTLEEVLELAQQFSVTFDLAPVFMQWVGKGHMSLMSLMLEMDPRLIELVTKLDRPLFADALLSKKEDEVQLILVALSHTSIKLREPDQWILRAYEGKTDFTDEAFRKLTPQLQQLLYTIANIYCRDAFVGRLNGLGLAAETPIVYPRHIVGPNMNVIDIRRALGHFLQTMRSKGLLLTREEFAKLDQSKFFNKSFGKIDRVLGRDYIEQTALRLNCRHIGAPLKYIVLDDTQPISVTVRGGQELQLNNAYTLYAAKVTPCSRKLTRDQMTQFLSVAGEVGYNDLSNQNCMVTPDSVQIIDTEKGAFSSMPGLGGNLDSLFSMMDPSDHAWLQQTIDSKLAEYAKTEKQVMRDLDARDKLCQADSAKFGFTHPRTFTFNIFSANAE